MCELLESIENIIKRSDDELKLLLSGQVIDADFTVDVINDYEEILVDIFDDSLDYYIANIDEFDTIQEFYLMRNARMLSNDPFSEWISISNTTMNAEYLFDMIPRYYMSVDTGFIIKADGLKDVFITKETFFKTTSLPTVEYMSTWPDKLGDLMGITNQRAVTDKIFEGLSEGKSIQWLKNELSELPEFSRVRARTTAITETLRADSYAANEA